MYNKSFLFDGDTIEFRTRNFYKKTVTDIIEEFQFSKIYFLNSLNRFLKEKKIWTEKLPLSIPEIYPGLAVMNTNPDNNVFFNNGTFHVNITLPTQLDKNGLIKDLDKFIEIHHICIKYIQWIFPLLITTFSSPDFLSFSGKYSKCSARLVISRYIGLGTYDPCKLTAGKQMSTTISNINTTKEIWWQNNLNNELDYLYPENTGYDINFFKHYQHGIEIRIFDAFPNKYISDLFGIIILLLDRVVNYLYEYNDHVNVASNSLEWNKMIKNCLINGSSALISESEKLLFSKIFMFNDDLFKSCKNFRNFNEIFFKKLFEDHCNGNITTKLYPNMKFTYVDLTQWSLAFNYKIFLPHSSKRLFTIWTLYEILKNKDGIYDLNDFLDIELLYIRILWILNFILFKEKKIFIKNKFNNIFEFKEALAFENWFSVDRILFPF
jgi:hypothetical protein